VNDPVTGEVQNVIEIKSKTEPAFMMKRVASSPPGAYGQEIGIGFGSHPKTSPQQPDSPPGLPPHLLRALLNTEPLERDPTLLPLPHHVMLNHFYSLPRKEDKMFILGVTQRYKEKFVTTVFYKPLDQKDTTTTTKAE